MTKAPGGSFVIGEGGNRYSGLTHRNDTAYGPSLFQVLNWRNRIAAAYLLDLLDMFSGCNCRRVISALGKSAWREKNDAEYATKSEPYTSCNPGADPGAHS